ncbi:hypothetical protein [Variovorax paradoxus]|uniref:Uncharacterized protein n=1 Tax=Variovorax paradoxus (strain EPS) TaxID=595537 RepID=E6V9U9_VARPE|nr:hypothetical protein [Variovorax paradoxus]ADU36237.1 hypothetical protein Varpa_2029 [Variovorax paradoxus EPS]
MTDHTVITTEDEYVRCKDQVYRQTIERDALNETIADISNAVAVWEVGHPPAEEAGPL